MILCSGESVGNKHESLWASIFRQSQAHTLVSQKHSTSLYHQLIRRSTLLPHSSSNNNSSVTVINKRKLLRRESYQPSFIKNTCDWLIITYTSVLTASYKSLFAYNCCRGTKQLNKEPAIFFTSLAICPAFLDSGLSTARVFKGYRKEYFKWRGCLSFKWRGYQKLAPDLWKHPWKPQQHIGELQTGVFSWWRL